MKFRYDKRAVRRLRREKGLDVTTMAARAKTSKANASMIDRGFQEPRASTLARLANALEVEPAQFFERQAS